MTAPLARGKPAEFGQEILRRRFRLVSERLSLEGKRVLDFGCGNGAQTLAFHAGPSVVVAVDIHRNDLATLRSAASRRAVSSIAPVLYDGDQLPLRSQSIDCVFSFEVLEHVPEESNALQELYRVLAPGGEGVMTVPNKWWLFETHGTILPWLPWHRVPFVSWLPPQVHRRIARARIYTQRSLRRVLVDHGFSVLAMQYVTAPMDALGVPWLQRLMRRTLFASDRTKLPMMATAILVHFRRP